MSRSVTDEYLRKTICVSSHGSLNHLTTREQQIVRLMMEGLTNKAIGELLGISERTVKFHASNILQKCHVENRRDLVVRLRKQELFALSSAKTSSAVQQMSVKVRPFG
jgi:DNA-binding NarL/FixJ family response regulator